MSAADESLISILVRRDRMSKEEAEEMVRYARERVREGEDPEKILYEEFGLEPDYIFQLL